MAISLVSATVAVIVPAQSDPELVTQSFVLGANSVDVAVDFESSQNRSLVNLGLTATLIPDINDPVLNARLPANVSIPAEFPVMIEISPPNIPVSGLMFSGLSSLELYTVDLHYTPGTKLRLFTAHDGGSFVDITEETSAGSYRVRGSQGEFSEFLIVLDNRDPVAIVNTKINRLTALISTHEAVIDETVYVALSAAFSNVISAWSTEEIDAAQSALASFGNIVANATPGEIPNMWQSTETVVNVGGILRAAASTLNYSLGNARDTDQDGKYDVADNCIAVANPSQCDTDNDGFGNHCDADMDNNNVVNSFDLSAFRQEFGETGSIAADLDCNGVVNSFDLSILRSAFGSAPGPAAR